MPTAGSPAEPIPVYLLGDSNVCSLADHIYRAASGCSYLFRALYVPGLRAREFPGLDGALGSRVSAALEAEQLLVKHGENLEAAHATSSTHWRWIREIAGRAGGPPPLVIAAGLIDLHAVSVAITEPDIALPDRLLADPLTPAICKVTHPDALDGERAAARYAAVLEPLRVGLRRLRALGFSTLGVLGYPPLTRDDESLDTAAAMAGFPIVPRPAPTAFRYKGLRLINAELARLCRDENAVFIDCWADFVAEDGLVRPGVLRDFIHFAPDASERCAGAIVSKLVERDRRGVPSLLSVPSSDREDELDGGTIFRQSLGDPHLAAVQALAAARAGHRVVEVGAAGTELALALAADGARVTKIEDGLAPVRATRNGAYDVRRVRFVSGDAMLADDVGVYDVAIVSDVDRLTPDDAERLYRDLATALRPSGMVIAHTVRNAWASRNGTAGTGERPDRLRRRLSAAFPHVVVWLAEAGDARGSLARRYTVSDARGAHSVLAVASREPLDIPALCARITTQPIEADEMQVRVTDPYAPRRVVRGQRFFAELTLHNESTATLSSFAPNPVRFAPMWIDRDGRAVSGHQTRSPIAPAARPHESARYALEIVPPAEPGLYTLRLALLQEFVRWYSTSADVTVAVV